MTRISDPNNPCRFCSLREVTRQNELAYCERCGMPSPLELCGFCRMAGDAPVTEFGALEEVRPAGAPVARPTGSAEIAGAR